MEVALAAIGLAATTVGGLIWTVKYFATAFVEALKAHTKAANKQADASEEVLQFMKNLNGKLENAYKQKVREVKREENNGR